MAARKVLTVGGMKNAHLIVLFSPPIKRCNYTKRKDFPSEMPTGPIKAPYRI